MAHRKLTCSVIVGLCTLVVIVMSSPLVGLAQSAKKAIQEVIVSNDDAHPVPVQSQGTTTVNVVAQTVTPVQ